MKNGFEFKEKYNCVGDVRHIGLFSCVEFVKASMHAAFLLNRRYMPYYKWSFRALRGLEGGAALAGKLSLLLGGDNSTPAIAEKKYDTIEEIASVTIASLREKELTNAICGDLEKHAYSVNDNIRDSNVRNMHILAAV